MNKDEALRALLKVEADRDDRADQSKEDFDALRRKVGDLRLLSEWARTSQQWKVVADQSEELGRWLVEHVALRARITARSEEDVEDARKVYSLSPDAEQVKQ